VSYFRSWQIVEKFYNRGPENVKIHSGVSAQDIIDKLIETVRCYEMEMNVEKTKVMRISRQPFPVKIMID